MNKSDLIGEYVDGAAMHGIGTRESNSQKANVGYARLNGAYRLLKEADPKLTELVPLLQHEDIAVRLWAACHLLPVQSDVALPVLEEIAKPRKGPFALDAMMTIKQWKQGELRFEG